ncbi:MAG: hypothetical protein AB1611_20405 [bacterium]
MRKAASFIILSLLFIVLLFFSFSIVSYVSCQHLMPDEVLDFSLTLKKRGQEPLGKLAIPKIVIRATDVLRFMNRLVYSLLCCRYFETPDRIYFPAFLSTTIILS